jgi:2'-5' RNA ligase
VQANGLFIIAEIGGEAGRQIREINERYDPRLARYKGPHVTITGSSGVGPIPPSVSVSELRDKLALITSSTPPMNLQLLPPIRFMQSEIIVLPLDPHGPLRIFHDRIATSGLPFQQARFTFSPHCTLSLYPTLSRETARELLAVRITSPARIDRIAVYQTLDPQPSKKLLELPLVAEDPQAMR